MEWKLFNEASCTNNIHTAEKYFRSCYTTAQKMKFSIKDFLCICDQIRSFFRIWSHLLKKSLMENFIFCAVYFWRFVSQFFPERVKKLVIYFGLCESSLDFQRREDQINIVYEK